MVCLAKTSRKIVVMGQTLSNVAGQVTIIEAERKAGCQGAILMVSVRAGQVKEMLMAPFANESTRNVSLVFFAGSLGLGDGIFGCRCWCAVCCSLPVFCPGILSL